MSVMVLMYDIEKIKYLLVIIKEDYCFSFFNVKNIEFL